MCVQQQQRQQQQVVRVTSVRIVCDDPIRPPIREREQRTQSTTRSYCTADSYRNMYTIIYKYIICIIADGDETNEKTSKSCVQREPVRTAGRGRDTMIGRFSLCRVILFFFFFYHT